jgi:hypothetical protein
VKRLQILAAFIWISALTGVLAWWIKGDLEMAWLVGVPLLIAGASLIGLSTAFLFRRIFPTLAATGAAVLLGAVLAYIAIQTPNGWSAAPPPAVVEAAARLSKNSTRLEAATSCVTGYPVEIDETKVQIRPGWVSKEGFSFRLRRRPATVEIVASYAAGPPDAAVFDLAEANGTWIPVARFDRKPSGLTFRPAAFLRRFPGIPQIEVGGQGQYSPGASLLVRVAHSETDWQLVLFKIGSNGRVLDEMERQGRNDALRELEHEISHRGLGPVSRISFQFHASSAFPVLFLNEPEFRFFAYLNDRYNGSLSFIARLQEGRITYEIERIFPRSPAAHPDP